MANLAQGWINHLCRQSKSDQAAPASTKEPPQEPSNDNVNDAALRPPSAAQAASGDPILEDVTLARKRLKSPTNFVKAGDRTRSPSPNRRSKPKQTTVDESTANFPARPAPRTKGRLWSEGDPILTRNPAAQASPQQHPRTSQRRDNNRVSSQTVEEKDPSVNTMLPQLETRPISREQLFAEVKGIYTGLVMLESKCVEVDRFQSVQNDLSPQLNIEQRQELIALHRSLHMHHDFFLASQPRPASLALRGLASKYAMPVRIWHHEICVLRGLESHVLPGSLEHMLAFIRLPYSMLALQYDTVPNHHGFCNEGVFVPDPNSTKLRHDHKVESMIFPRIEEPPPEEWSLLRLLWADKVLLGNRSKSEIFDKDERKFEPIPHPKDSHGRVPWGGSKDGYSRSPGFCSEAFDNLQSMVHADNLFTPGYYSIPLSLLSNIPRRFQLLAVLAFTAIPIVSANVGVMEWAFGILASIPSTYILANPPVPPIVDNGPEEIVWKLARGWGLTFGLVFAALLVTRLRTKYPPDKRMYFVSVVFATSLAVMLLLLHFMRDDTWNVLDLLALCVCFCATATYITTSESRGRETVARNRDEEEGAYQSLQDNPAGIQSDQPPQVQGGPQPGGEEEDTSAELRSSSPLPELWRSFERWLSSAIII